MRSNSPIGDFQKGGHPYWVFDIQATSLFWIPKALELNRMVELGFSAWRQDLYTLRKFSEADGLTPYQHNPTTLTVSFFLAALAIENLLKALLVKAHPEYIKNGKFRDKFITSHDLKKIAFDAGVPLTADEEDFCEFGTEAIKHFGRYHLAKNFLESPDILIVKDTAFPIYEELFNRLLSDVESNPCNNK